MLFIIIYARIINRMTSICYCKHCLSIKEAGMNKVSDEVILAVIKAVEGIVIAIITAKTHS